jgi:hypothetical protein
MHLNSCLRHLIWGYEDFTRLLRLPWWGLVPDQSTIHEAFRHIPETYFNMILVGSAKRYIAEAVWVMGILAADSTGVETERYETVEVKMKKTRRKINIKYHVTTILDYNIIMAAKIMGERTADSSTLRQMLKNLPQIAR